MNIYRHIKCGLLLLILLATCQPENKTPNILYINSYHDGYGSSDEITKGIKETLSGKDVNLKILYMDSKRNSDPVYLKQISGTISNMILKDPPKVIITSDDNAVKYIVSTHLKDLSVPIVFCGVNWSAEQYDLPSDHVTGILEILPFKEGIEWARRYFPDLKKVYILSENTVSETKNTEFISHIARNIGIDLTYTLADDFLAWQSGFLEANNCCDLIYMPTNGAIKHWNDEEAIAFVMNHLHIPIITCDDFMMPYAVFGLTKVQSEQGVRAAETALKILKGADVANIPVTENQQIDIWYNPDLAERLNFSLDEGHIQEVKIFHY